MCAFGRAEGMHFGGVGEFLTSILQCTYIYTHTCDYSYYWALTAAFLMGTNQVIKARPTLSQYFHARDICERKY
jgi:hypothetical protein